MAMLSQTCLHSVFNHPYFHFSHAIMFICYMLPFGSPCQLILLIRIGLAGATTIMALWARNVQCWVDSLLWNAASAAVNVVHILVLFYQLRPIKFNDELELVNSLIFVLRRFCFLSGPHVTYQICVEPYRRCVIRFSTIVNLPDGVL